MINYFIILCLLYPYGTFHVESEPVILNITGSNETITLITTCDYTIYSPRVFCLSRSLWYKPLPYAPVRLVLKCKSRYQDYWFGTDLSYRDKTGIHWLKIIDNEALTRIPGVTYIVDGNKPIISGQITLANCIKI